MKRKIVIGIVAVAVAIMAIALIGMWLDFCDIAVFGMGNPRRKIV